MFQELFDSIPDQGTINLTIKKSSASEASVILVRKFKNETNLQPLMITATAAELETQLTGIIRQYKRVSDLAHQVENTYSKLEEKSAKAKTETETKATPEKVPAKTEPKAASTESISEKASPTDTLFG